jgi:hypothetical protein
MRGNFYRLRERVRGGGEAGSNTKELAEEDKTVAGGPMRKGAEIAAALGSTKTTTPVATGSLGWQQAMLQSIAAFRAWCSHAAIGASFAELESLEPFFGACPCSGHIAPSQQAIPAACNAEAHAGAHKSITATKHTHARNRLPAALESWRVCCIALKPQNTARIGNRKPVSFPAKNQLPKYSG